MLNKQTVMGRLVDAPQGRRTESGTTRCTFTVASQDDRKLPGGEYETDFIDCVAWSGTADFILKNCTKGRLVVLEGRPKTRKYTDKNNVTHKVTELKVANVWIIDNTKAEDPPAVPDPRAADDEDLPF